VSSPRTLPSSGRLGKARRGHVDSRAPLDPETAIRAILKVDPKSAPAEDEDTEKDEGPAD
jgi:hypothetical protein